MDGEHFATVGADHVVKVGIFSIRQGILTFFVSPKTKFQKKRSADLKFCVEISKNSH
jgi:hypothetical protein